MCELRSGSGVAEARPGDGSDRPGAQVRERDVLLATKLRVPRSRRDVLVRPRLLDRIEEAAARELLLVSAPAGFGKSTLLTEWARTTTRPVGWASLDSDDNDPVRLWRYVVAAVEQVHPGHEERTKGWVTGRSDGQQLLEDLERANLFLVALDGQRRWYRYHRLFADLLRVR